MDQKIKMLMNDMKELAEEKQKILDREAELKTQFLEIMQNQNINVFENVHIRINYIAGFVRNGIDANKLRKHYPEAALACAKKSSVEPYVKVTVKT